MGMDARWASLRGRVSVTLAPARKEQEARFEASLSLAMGVEQTAPSAVGQAASPPAPASAAMKSGGGWHPRAAAITPSDSSPRAPRKPGRDMVACARVALDRGPETVLTGGPGGQGRVPRGGARDPRFLTA